MQSLAARASEVQPWHPAGRRRDRSLRPAIRLPPLGDGPTPSPACGCGQVVTTSCVEQRDTRERRRDRAATGLVGIQANSPMRSAPAGVRRGGGAGSPSGAASRPGIVFYSALHSRAAWPRWGSVARIGDQAALGFAAVPAAGDRHGAGAVGAYGPIDSALSSRRRFCSRFRSASACGYSSFVEEGCGFQRPARNNRVARRAARAGSIRVMHLGRSMVAGRARTPCVVWRASAGRAARDAEVEHLDVAARGRRRP